LQLFNRPYSLIDPAIQYVTATGQRLDLSWNYSPKWKMNLSYLHQNSEQQLIERIVRARGYATRNEKRSVSVQVLYGSLIRAGV
jgi:hypothetical protein